MLDAGHGSNAYTKHSLSLYMLGTFENPDRFVASLTKTRTSEEPMNPAPPVTKTFSPVLVTLLGPIQKESHRHDVSVSTMHFLFSPKYSLYYEPSTAI